MVVACVAGFGAWGTASVSVSPNPTYASELFGSDSVAIKYPDGMTPTVTLSIPANLGAVAARTGDDPCTAVAATNYTGAAEVTFALVGGATFNANVSGLMYDDNAAPADTTAAVAAIGTIASIVSGGRKGDSSITIKIEEASGDNATRNNRSSDRTRADAPSCSVTVNSPDNNVPHAISFDLPVLTNLSGSLKDASKAKTMMRQVSLRAESRIISGAFTDGFLTGNPLNAFTTAVIKSRDAVTVSISDPNAKDIVIKGDSMFKAVKGANADGYVELATVTVSTRTKHVTKAKVDTPAKTVYRLSSAAATLTPGATDAHVYTAAMSSPEMSDTLYGLDGKEIDAGLRGTLTVDAMGTRDLFNDGDMLFVDYDGNKKMGGSEGIAIDGDTGTGTALSVDPDTSESFKGGVGTFKVYYMAGGKESINHGATIKLMANVDYSNPSATDEAQKSTSTTFNFEGVRNPVKAYAIPHSTNGTGDKANVRVRCEVTAGCRVFVECWDDMGMRSFGEAGEIEGNALAKWDAAAVESVVGITDPSSRHSCRILSVGKVTVQQLTRDGNSKTLVNNTFIGGE